MRGAPQGGWLGLGQRGWGEGGGPLLAHERRCPPPQLLGAL